MIKRIVSKRESKSLVSVFPEVAKFPLPTIGEVEAILARFKAGEKGVDDELMRVCYRFVASVAKQYIGLGVTQEELLDAGFKGLRMAAQKYDTNDKFKFICYAIWWMRNSIQLAVNEHTNLNK